MIFNRAEAKALAKESMRLSKPNAVLVGVVFFLLTTVLSALVESLLGGGIVYYIQSFYTYLLAGYEPTEILLYLGTTSIGTSFVVSLLIDLYILVMGVGFTSYSLRAARREQAGYKNLFDGMAMIGRVIRTTILMAIYIFLWSLVAIIPGMLVVIAGIFMLNSVVINLGFLLYFVGVIFAVTVSYRYRLAYYFLIDNPEMGATEALRESKETMAGRKASLFLLDLSFLPWIILGLLTFTILYVWLTPYMYITEANFYDLAVHKRYSAPTEQKPWERDDFVR